MAVSFLSHMFINVQEFYHVSEFIFLSLFSYWFGKVWCFYTWKRWKKAWAVMIVVNQIQQKKSFAASKHSNRYLKILLEIFLIIFKKTLSRVLLGFFRMWGKGIDDLSLLYFIPVFWLVILKLRSFPIIFRKDGKISRKLIECINTYLLKDGPNLGCQSLEIHYAVQQFVFHCWSTVQDRGVKVV